MTGTTGTGAARAARRGLGRAVVFAGTAVGTFVTVTAYAEGFRPPASGLAALLAGVITWLLFAVLAVTVLEVLRRHHRAIGRHGWRGIRATGRRTRGGARWATARLAAKAAPRWDRRNHRPLMFTRAPVAAAGDAEEQNGEKAGEDGSPDPGPTYSWGPADSPSGWPADDPATAHRWARHMSTGGGKPQVVTEYPPGGGPGKTVATYVNGKPSTEGKPMPPNLTGLHSGPRFREHTFAECSPGLCGEPAGKLAGASAPRGHRVLTIGGTVPGEWKNLVAITADFEPQDDAELLAWMASEVTGMSAYAEALTEVYETGVSSVGLDPVSLAALHDTADAAAEAAQAMAAARQKFAAHYAEVREFAAAGGLLPHDGRWITGEGE